MALVPNIIINALTGILTQIPMLIIIIWGVRIVAREMPKWLRQYHEQNMKEIALQKAIGMRR